VQAWKDCIYLDRDNHFVGLVKDCKDLIGNQDVNTLGFIPRTVNRAARYSA